MPILTGKDDRSFSQHKCDKIQQMIFAFVGDQGRTLYFNEIQQILDKIDKVKNKDFIYGEL